jgi:hypothetical protein
VSNDSSVHADVVLPFDKPDFHDEHLLHPLLFAIPSQIRRALRVGQFWTPIPAKGRSLLHAVLQQGLLKGKLLCCQVE